MKRFLFLVALLTLITIIPAHAQGQPTPIPLTGQPAQIPSGVEIQNSLAVLAGNQQIAAQQAIKTQQEQTALQLQQQALNGNKTMPAGTGNELLARCKEQSAYSQGHCIGFISGFITGFRNGVKQQSLSEKTIPDDGLNLYIPDTATVGQLVDIVVKYLENHPETRHESSGLLIYCAAREAFLPKQAAQKEAK